MSWLLEISSILFQVDINHNCWKLFFSNRWCRCSLFHITAAHTATLCSIELQCFPGHAGEIDWYVTSYKI